ncbi:MAG: phage capsid protein [Corynebacterium sp.]|nr:phage capsid protein [Corynebacterium sp.]
MPITLASAAMNTQEAYNAAIIDEFRKNSVLLDTLIYEPAVNPAGGGATLTYGYRRQTTQRGADFRAINSEYATASTTTEHKTVSLVPLGGAFDIDRVLAHIGPAASDEVATQMAQLTKATNARFCDAVINGDTAVDSNGFDGLDKALLGSSTEINKTGEKDWTDLNAGHTANNVIDDLDELCAELDGPPTLLLANKRALGKLRSAARRANMYVTAPVEGLVWANGNTVEHEKIGNLIIVDPGTKSGSNEEIIPTINGKTSIYAVRIATDGFCGITTSDGEMIKSWLPDFSTAGAVKTGEVELGPIAVALKATKAAAVMRNIKVG